MAKKLPSEQEVRKEVLNSVNILRHFDCDASTICNRFHNVLVERWSEFVPQLITQLNSREIANGELKGEAKEQLKRKLLDRLFQKGKLTIIFQRFSQKLEKNFLNLPRGFVLAEDRENAELSLKVDEKLEEDRLLREIHVEKEKIVELRYKLQILDQLNEHLDNSGNHQETVERMEE
ncbi:hypothetical protein M3Y94_00777400 [Aphelenchoides besseyi]|nr:hypothetical protein M3Y94_00777400 [Aphelenchoides besseyi]KAI6232323.1 hypothetical protein M3Y95_00474000 [Aphelenchoides besseyi]